MNDHFSTHLPVPGASSSGADLGPRRHARYAEWMERALRVAEEVGDSGDVPIGAVVLDEAGTQIAQGWNVREAQADPTGHAEIVALRAAGQVRGGWRLDGCTLVVTLEPCPMCAGAAMLARVDRIVFGAWDDKAGACGSVWDLPRERRSLHRPEVVGGVLAARAGERLVNFFTPHRLR